MCTMVVSIQITKFKLLSHIHAGALITEMESETYSTLKVTIFNASITGDEFDSAIQLPNVRLVVA